MDAMMRYNVPTTKYRSYRSLPIWAHVIIIAASGFAELFYGGIIVPPLIEFMKAVNDLSFTALYKNLMLEGGSPLFYSGILVLLGHAGLAIGYLIVGVASLDALKERLLGSGPVRPD